MRRIRLHLGRTKGGGQDSGDGPGGQLEVAEGLPLFGRDAEWKRIRESLDHVRSGGSRVVFIEGEAGIGKTRLVEE